MLTAAPVSSINSYSADKKPGDEGHGLPVMYLRQQSQAEPECGSPQPPTGSLGWGPEWVLGTMEVGHLETTQGEKGRGHCLAAGGGC